MTFQSSDMRGLTTRRLLNAIVASLLLHLVVLWPSSLRVLTRDAPSALQATLRALPTPPAERPPPKPLAAAPAPVIASPVPKPASPVLEQSAADSVPQTLGAHADPAVKPASRSEPLPTAVVATSATGEAAGLARGPLLTEFNASGEALDGLRGYRLAVATQARRFKRYPPQAMASGWAGSADIRVEVGSDGRPRAATLVRSSGHEVLDRAALAMIDAGALRARLSDSLRGKTFAVVLPVVFNLDDE
jgi:protein TonB